MAAAAARNHPDPGAAVSRLSWLECRLGPMKGNDSAALAAAIRVQTGLTTPDSLQAASCLQLGGEHMFLTGDSAFRRVAGVLLKLLSPTSWSSRHVEWIAGGGCVSTLSLFEIATTLRDEIGVAAKEAQGLIHMIRNKFRIVVTCPHTLNEAIDLSEQHDLSYRSALSVATAIKAGSSLIYTLTSSQAPRTIVSISVVNPFAVLQLHSEPD